MNFLKLNFSIVNNWNNSNFKLMQMQVEAAKKRQSHLNSNIKVN